MILFRSTVNQVLSTATAVAKTPIAIYQFLSDCCKQSNRQHKLNLVAHLREFHSAKRQVSNANFMQEFQEFFVEVQQKHINIKELLGLVLQSIVKPPVSADENTFRNNLNHRLNTSVNIPSFDRVCQEITQVKGKLIAGSSSSNPITINRLQQKPTNNSNNQKGKQSENQPNQPQPAGRAITNALAFQGIAPTPSQMAEKGSKCNYCQRDGHWISMCRTLMRDIGSGKIQVQRPSTSGNNNPDKVRIRAINARDNASDVVLIDSGASACVSGDSPFFTLERRLIKPIPVLLASRNSSLILTGVGSLKIPTPNGTLRVRNVYHHPNIPYAILSLGILATHGMLPVFNNKCGMSLHFKNCTFHTKFSNNCWTLLTSHSPPTIRTSLPSPNSTVVISSMTNKPSMDCKCVLAKATGHCFLPPSIVPKEEPLDLFVSDVMGPFDDDVHGFKFAVTLRDHASMFTFVLPMHSKADVPERLKTWFETVHTHLGRYPKFLRCDNGGKFTSKRFENILAKRGIQLVTSAPYHPKENGEAERVNRTIKDMARVMLNGSGLPFEFWSYAQQTAAYLHNQIPHSHISPCTPIEVLFNQKPTPDYIFPFGARALVFCPTKKQDNKFSAHADKSFLIGYPPSGKGWLFYNKNLRTITQSADTVFPDYQQVPVSSFDTIAQQETVEINNLCLGKVPTNKIAAAQDLAIQSLPVRSDIAIPTNIHHALSGSNGNRWRQAAEAELCQLEKLGVWSVVKPVKGRKVIGTRWVFALKRDTLGDITKFKARYVARGFNQRPGQDCGDTYAPTASLATLRLLLSISVQKGFTTHSFDVSSAYLYSPIKEEVYVKPPSKLRPSLKGKVLRLHKALYGTKQAGRCWWLHFKKILSGLNFSASEVESSLYVYKRDDISIYIWMHVDDGLVVSNSAAALEDLRSNLTQHLEVKWKTTVDQIVGLNVHHLDSGIHLEQHLLSNQVVNTYHRRAIHQNTPLPDSSLVTSTSAPVDTTSFWSVLGLLMYLACGTRPNISYAVNLLARFSQNPSEEHWYALDHLVGYIKKNPQHVVAMSTCTAEYVALSIATQHLANLKIVLDNIDPVSEYEILCDNQAAVLVATDNASKKKTRYLQCAFYFVNDFVRRNKVNLFCISNSGTLVS
ncbi:hypothetical protein PCASD_01135 [Puccinia coronata f. sp. avenae]|uniref:Integrase catalytic domain-containing protein n=1 Tax=Puccinia coronata f. sp. avenae TaxID=200324 RepID=A0A2N5VLI2_9BASI|nr:hypothetical protein PCASD_01135 [Puccinia coronata f. sp. avenae]